MIIRGRAGRCQGRSDTEFRNISIPFCWRVPGLGRHVDGHRRRGPCGSRGGEQRGPGAGVRREMLHRIAVIVVRGGAARTARRRAKVSGARASWASAANVGRGPQVT